MNSVPTILVLHGALGATSQMPPIADALAALGRVRTIEFPGHGVTPLADGASFAMHTFIDALARHALETNHSKSIVFGYSMGGYVALACESRNPGTFAGIATLGTKFDWTPDIAEREALRLDPHKILEKIPRFAEALELRHRDAGGWHQVVEHTASLLRDNARLPIVNANSLSQITIPVRIAVGSRDETVTWGETAAAANAMRNATALQLENVAHPIERVPAETIVELVRPLLSTQ